MEKLSKRQVLPFESTRERILGEIDRIIVKVNEIVDVINAIERVNQRVAWMTSLKGDK